MSVIVVTAPDPVVTLAEAKLHCRVDESDTVSDALIGAYIDAATRWIDGPAGWLGRAIGSQELEWRSDSWPCHGFLLPYPPLIKILSVIYIDPDGDEQEWPVPEQVYWADMPAVRGRTEDIKIRYRAGYETVPAPIKVAILLMVANYYENREAVGSGKAVLPMGAEALLSTYRVYSF